MTSCLTVNITLNVYFALLEIILLVSFKDLETRLCSHNEKRGCISALQKGLLKGGVKKQFCLCGNLGCEFAFSVTFKVIDSPERRSSKIHPRYFTFAFCLISIPLYTMLKDLAF